MSKSIKAGNNEVRITGNSQSGYCSVLVVLYEASETITEIGANHKTLKGAEKWAGRVLAR